jgi:hypothetical protein
MSPATVATERSEFRNDAGHVIGVITRRENNLMKSMALMPDQTVWLDEEEQIATANAPRFDDDNPFENGFLTLVTKAENIINRRRIGYTKQPQVRVPTEESDPGGDTGTTEEAPSAPPQVEDDAGSGQLGGSDNPSGKVETLADKEANAKAHAARAVSGGATAQQPAPKPKVVNAAKPAETKGTATDTAAAPQGKRAEAEIVGTPEAEGK